MLTTHSIYEVFPKQPKSSQPSWDCKEFYHLFRPGHTPHLVCEFLPDTLVKIANQTKLPSLPSLIHFSQ